MKTSTSLLGLTLGGLLALTISTSASAGDRDRGGIFIGIYSGNPPPAVVYVNPSRPRHGAQNYRDGHRYGSHWSGYRNGYRNGHRHGHYQGNHRGGYHNSYRHGRAPAAHYHGRAWIGDHR